MTEWDGTIPDGVPQDLLTDNERKVNGQLTNVLWIRTWYGTTDGSAASSSSNQSSEDQGEADNALVSRDTADAAYRRLWRRAFLWNPDDEDEVYDDSSIPSPFIFDNDAARFSVRQTSKEQIITPTGTVPDFVLNVLMKCPDQMEGSSDSSWRHDDEETIAAEQEHLSQAQKLLLMIADREACEDGWVLEIAINHKGEVVPGRVRIKAVHTRENAGQWLTEGMALDEATEGKDEEIYYYEGDGWASD